MRRRQFITLLGGVGIAWPLVVRAQQKSLPVIGFMSSRSPEDSQSVLTGFRKGLSESGLVEGGDAVIEFGWARGKTAWLLHEPFPPVPLCFASCSTRSFHRLSGKLQDCEKRQARSVSRSPSSTQALTPNSMRHFRL